MKEKLTNKLIHYISIAVVGVFAELFICIFISDALCKKEFGPQTVKGSLLKNLIDEKEKITNDESLKQTPLNMPDLLNVREQYYQKQLLEEKIDKLRLEKEYTEQTYSSNILLCFLIIDVLTLIILLAINRSKE